MRTMLFFFLITLIGNSAFSQGRIFQLDVNNDGVYDNAFAAAVKTEQFVNYRAAVKTQEQSNWCWAACIQMVLKYQGLYVQQCNIVKKAFNMSSCIDKPADCYTIQDGVNGWNVNNRKIIGEVDFSATANELIDQLANRYPVIIGLNMPGQNIGHAYVLTAVYFKYDSNNRRIPYKVAMRDPWPENPSRQEFRWSDFVNRINCITYVTF